MQQLLVILLFFIISIVSLSCSGDGSADQQANSTFGIPVKTMLLQPRPFAEYLQLTGTLEARNRINILAEEPGILTRVVRDKGSLVKSGDTLAFIENKIISASYQEASAALRQAELDNSSKKVLYEKRAISENEYLVAKYGFERAQASYELNKARYSKLTITAPISGYVNHRLYDLGAYALPMTPIFDFIDNAYMKIIAGVAERFLDDIQVGTPVEITFDAFPDLKLQSEVDYINQSIDQSSRTFRIEIKIPNPDRKLAPQMIANVKLLRRSYLDQIVIPMDAIIESERGRYVFIASPDQKAMRVAVDLLAIYEDSALVQGLQPKQQLIVVGQQELTQDDPVKIQNN